jgi:hypothetical protein
MPNASSQISYLEKCIASLPPEKQAAAREAFRAISENGEDNLISKLLVILEATSAYAATIPQAFADNGEHFLKELDARLLKSSQERSGQESAEDERLRKLLASALPAALQGHAAELGHIRRGMIRMRRARVGGLLFLMLIGFLLGASAVVSLGWRSYREGQEAQRFEEMLSDAGITANIQETDAGQVLTIEGPEILDGTAWRKDAKGYIIGADMVFPKRQTQ